MKKLITEYTALTTLAVKCGLIPYVEFNAIKPGFYTLPNLEAPIDLTACALNEISIYKTALKQLSERADEAFHHSIERSLTD